MKVCNKEKREREAKREIYAQPAHPSQVSSPSSSSRHRKHAGDPVPGGQTGELWRCVSDAIFSIFQVSFLGYVRGHVGIQQDVAVLEILHARAGLEVFLQRVAALEVCGEGGLVDGHGG
jgi:hypothetical protein